MKSTIYRLRVMAEARSDSGVLLVVRAAERYEFVRKLAPIRFAALYQENLQGKLSFDQLIDREMQKDGHAAVNERIRLIASEQLSQGELYLMACDVLRQDYLAPGVRPFFTDVHESTRHAAALGLSLPFDYEKLQSDARALLSVEGVLAPNPAMPGKD